MAAPLPEFVTYCLELLQSVGPCLARRMFGGWGISHDGLTLAIIADLGDGERLWLKTDASNLSAFEAAGCPRFTYQAKGKTMGMNYHGAPESAMESPAQMHDWAQLAWGAALRAHAPKTQAPARRRAPAQRPPKPSQP